MPGNRLDDLFGPPAGGSPLDDLFGSPQTNPLDDLFGRPISDAAAGIRPEDVYADEDEIGLLSGSATRAGLNAPGAFARAGSFLSRLVFPGGGAHLRRGIDEAFSAPEEAAAELNVREPSGIIEKGVSAAIESSPQMAATIASGPLAMLTAAGFAGSASEKEALDRGLDPAVALLKGVASGALVAPLETIGAKGVGKLLQKLPVGEAVSRARQLLVAAGKESTTEAAQELVDLALEAVTGKDVSMAEIVDRTSTAAVAGGFTAAGARAVGAGYDQLGKVAARAPASQAGAVELGGAPEVAARIGADLSSFIKRQLTVRKGLPEQEFQMGEEMEAMIDAEGFAAAERAGRLARAREEISGGDPEIATQVTNAYQRYIIDPDYRDGEGQHLDESVRSVAQEARDHIDGLSMALVESGALTPEQELVIGKVLEDGDRKGLGKYLRRSYAAFDDPQAQFRRIGGTRKGWNLKELTTEWEGLREYFGAEPDMQRRLKDRTPEEQQSILDNEIGSLFSKIQEERRATGSLTSFDLFGSIDRTAVKHRKDVDGRLRNALGEKKGELAYVDTVAAMSRMLYKTKLYTNLLQGPIGRLFHVAPVAEAPGDYVRLRDSKSPTAQEIISLAAGRPALGPKQPYAPPGQRVQSKGDIRQFDLPGVEGATTAGKLRGMTNPQLQTILSDMGLDTTGKKTELVERITDGATREGLPVDELFVHKNLISAFDKAFMATNPMARSIETLKEQRPILGGVLDVLVKGSGFAKSSLTVFKPMSHVRNFVSNPLAAVASGGLPMTRKAWSGARQRTMGMVKSGTRYGGKMSADQRAETEKRIRLGIYTANVDAGDHELYLGDVTRRFTSGTERVAETLQEKGAAGKVAAEAVRLPGGAVAAAPRAYQGEDNFWKDIAFTFERAQLAKMKPELKGANADAHGIDALDREAAELVKQTMQNYNRIPELVEQLRIFPFMGPFVSFPTAVAINLKNQTKRGLQEVGFVAPDEGSVLTPGIGKDLRQTQRGVRRLGALGGVLWGGSKITGFALGAVADLASHLGIDFEPGSEEDDEQTQRDYLDSLPPWSQNSKIKVLGKSKTEAGVGYSIDLSYSDYFGSVTKPIMAALRSGRHDEDAWRAALTEALEPYFSADVFFGTLMEVFTNEDQYGRKIHLEGSGLGEWMKDYGTHLILGTNGVADTAWRLAHGALDEKDSRGRSFHFATELFAQTSGIRVMKTDFGDNIRHKAGHAKAMLDHANQVIREKLIVPEPIAMHTLEQTAKTHLEGTSRVLREALRAVEIAQRRDVSEERAITTFRDSGLQKSITAQLLGGVPAKEVAKEWLRAAYERVNKSRGERMREALRRWEERKIPKGATPDELRRETERLQGLWQPLDLSLFN